MQVSWKSLVYITKFSIVAFAITAFLGLFSMGLLGVGLYYPVSFLLKGFPPFDDWHGDWVWPATISVGMLWSFGFLLGSVVWRCIHKTISSKTVLWIVYVFVLWAWAGLLWYLTLIKNVNDPLLTFL